MESLKVGGLQFGADRKPVGPARMTDAHRADLAYDALCTILHRITGTLAEDWVAPNPRASERCAMSQYPGTLADFIFATLQAIEGGMLPEDGHEKAPQDAPGGLNPSPGGDGEVSAEGRGPDSAAAPPPH